MKGYLTSYGYMGFVAGRWILFATESEYYEYLNGRDKMTRAETLDKAKQCVCGQRENEYGSPEDNFQSIAALWSVYKNTDFTATDVAMMMALLKIARIKTGTSTEDSFVDLAGYAACGAEIASNTNKEKEII